MCVRQLNKQSLPLSFMKLLYFKCKTKTKPKSQLGRLLLAAVVVVVVCCSMSNRAHSKIDLSELLHTHTHNHRTDSKRIRILYDFESKSQSSQ